jgi:hypothetical protein
MSAEDEPVTTIRYTYDNFLANSAAVVTEVFVHPLSTSRIVHPPQPAGGRAGSRLPDTHIIRVDPTFKMVFIAVCGFTALAFGFDIYLTEMVTPAADATAKAAHNNLLNLLGAAWTAGVGAIIGLLGGKNLE